MYGPKKKKMGTGGKAKRQGMMNGKMPKRKPANMGRMMYRDGGMTPAKPN